eukprot:2342440-Pleurochrysis_carterae.AAC.5
MVISATGTSVRVSCVASAATAPAAAAVLHAWVCVAFGTLPTSTISRAVAAMRRPIAIASATLFDWRALDGSKELHCNAPSARTRSGRVHALRPTHIRRARIRRARIRRSRARCRYVRRPCCCHVRRRHRRHLHMRLRRRLRLRCRQPLLLPRRTGALGRSPLRQLSPVQRMIRKHFLLLRKLLPCLLKEQRQLAVPRALLYVPRARRFLRFDEHVKPLLHFGNLNTRHVLDGAELLLQSAHYQLALEHLCAKLSLSGSIKRGRRAVSFALALARRICTIPVAVNDPCAW